MILEATHSHLYSGLRGSVAGPARIADLAADRECLVAFADGSAATASLTRPGEDWQLQTDAYRTAAGTPVAANKWALDLVEIGERIEFRILGKIRE